MTSCMCNAGPLSLPGEDSGSASDEDELSNTVYLGGGGLGVGGRGGRGELQ
jgi:hypothetical protein